MQVGFKISESGFTLEIYFCSRRLFSLPPQRGGGSGATQGLWRATAAARGWEGPPPQGAGEGRRGHKGLGRDAAAMGQ